MRWHGMMNILIESILPIEQQNGSSRLISLSELLAELGHDTIVDFPFLRPHQRHPWHAFLVQLAALSLHRAGEPEVRQPAERWLTMLRALTPAWPDDSPWCLVVEDLAKPGFMQPPVPEGTLASFKNVVDTADDLDVLVTSKNHGVKQGQASVSEPAFWIASLVSLQTTAGFLGAGNYGVVRMNGGFATRPGIGLVPEGGPGARWLRDVRLHLRHRDWFFGRVPQFARDNGTALLWCRPWDGKQSIALDQLDPWFIEISRRVRLANTARRMQALVTTSAVQRIGAGALKGNVGDPWIPTNRQNDSAAYNSAPRYETAANVLFDPAKWDLPLCLQWHPGIDAAPMIARFEVFVRGQGKTEGYTVRDVPLSKQRLLWIATPDERERLAIIAKGMVESIRTLLGGRIMRTALLALVQGGPEAVKFGDKTATAWVDKLLADADDEGDRAFFDQLFARAENEEAGRRGWLLFLRALAVSTFERAIETLPVPAPRRLRAIAVAERILWGGFYKTFPELAPKRAEEPVDVV